MITDLKVCSRCKNSKEPAEFHVRTKAKDGRDRTCKSCKKLYHSNYHKTHRTKTKEAAIKAYGGVCYCCGEQDLRFLSLDHANNDGAAFRKSFGYSDVRKAISGYTFYRWLLNRGFPTNLGLQTACFNCNSGRAINGGICPHADKTTLTQP